MNRDVLLWIGSIGAVLDVILAVAIMASAMHRYKEMAKQVKRLDNDHVQLRRDIDLCLAAQDALPSPGATPGPVEACWEGTQRRMPPRSPQ